ncbi:heparinase II/III family protein [Thiotrichales bacterium 19S11-10]|nr:heparinase II/III family protein [Thiotrichales bacterium 19S11-10]
MSETSALSLALSKQAGPWQLSILRDKRYFLDENTISFLNQSGRIDYSLDWNDRSKEKLWLYNLHYFDGLCVQVQHQRELTYKLLLRWIKDNKVGQGNGWEPYPISLRIVNTIKYVLMGNQISDSVKQSLYIQACYLNKICEYHILGNHLFENLKALCFVGLFFNGKEADKWLRKGLKGLESEIKEQVLEDGGHFELSPMYHCIILEGLLDLYNIFHAYNKKGQFRFDDKISQMVNWLKYMSRNSQSISYFNDAADGIASTPEELFDYANRLGFNVAMNTNNGLVHLSSSGYAVFISSRLKAILDVASIGPDYLPGHAHADSLSFELIIDRFPVFVNLGTSCYGRSQRRHFERSTKAHNTLVMNNQSSSEMWSGFRVARRACVEVLELNGNSAELSSTVKAQHNGYQRIDKQAIHYRTWQFYHNRLVVTDMLSGSGSADILLHLHPLCEIIYLGEHNVVVRLPNQSEVNIQFETEVKVIQSKYANTFGDLLPTSTLQCQLDNNKRMSTQTIFWDK